MSHHYELDSPVKNGRLDTAEQGALRRLPVLVTSLLDVPAALVVRFNERGGPRVVTARHLSGVEEGLGARFSRRHVPSGELLIDEGQRASGLRITHVDAKEVPAQFSVGLPVHDKAGRHVGEVWAFDTEQRALRPEDRTALHQLAQLATEALADDAGSESALRAEAQRALQESEQRWHRLVESHPDPITVRVGDRFAYVNQAAARVAGAEDPEEIIGRRVEDFLVPVEREAYRERSTKVDQGEQVQPRLFRIRRLDGEERIIEAHVKPVTYKGQPAGQSVIRDVTERERRRRQRRRRTERLKRQQNVLVGLASYQREADNLVDILRHLTEVTGRTLDVARCSVWLFEEERSVFRCRDCYLTGSDAHEFGEELATAEHETYLRHLKEERIFASTDAQADSRLREFRPYLEEHGITSLLAVPIRLEGELVGMVLIEHRGGERSWRPDEQHFVGSVADFAALALEADRRRATEQALRKSRQRYQHVADTIDEVLFRTDREGRYTFLNSAWEKHTGYSVEESLGTYFYEYLHADDQQAELEEYRDRIRARKMRYQKQLRLRTRAGDVRWFEARFRILRDENGRFMGGAGTLQDITERKRAEEAIRAAETKFRSLVEQSLVGVYIIQEDGLTYANPRLAEIFGYEQEEMCNVSAETFVVPEDREKVAGKIQRRMNEEEEDAHYTFRGQRKDGTVIHVEVHGRRAEHEGRPAIIGTMLDVTERKRAEAALRESRELLASINANISDGIYRSTRDAQGGHLEYVNEAFARLFGFDSVEDALQVDPHELYACPERRSQIDDEMQEDGRIRNAEVEFKRQDGSTFWGLLNSQAVLDDDGQPLYWDGAISDITKKKQRERMLVEAKEKAEEMNRLKTTFLANMSHEIRTPLTSIIGFADVLANEVDIEKKELVDLIRQSGQRLMETLNSVLHLAQLESDTLELELEPLSVGAQVQEAVQMFYPQAEEKGLALRVNEPTSPVRACLDQGALNRILTNLVSNAVKFTEHGRVIVHVEPDEEQVQIRVKDTGVGIEEEFLADLFSEFKQESSGLARGYEGSGLGLAITKRLVEMMDGTIAVESEKGEGSTFTVAFPRLQEA